jgi:hypothetical protein
LSKTKASVGDGGKDATCIPINRMGHPALRLADGTVTAALFAGSILFETG